MKVTKIVQQEKRRERYSIFVDHKYAFSLSEVALLDSQLAAGRELTKEELQDWKQHSADHRLYGNTLRYALRRPHSRWEMETYLRRKKASPALSTDILNKLSDMGLLGDLAFARSWMSSRQLLRPTSRRKLQQELRAKRVSEDVIEEAMTEHDAAQDLAALRALVQKKRQSPACRQNELKLMNYLARQGFGYGDIKRVVQEEREAND